MGGTHLAGPRRTVDAWLMNKVFVGRAIDIGAGSDPLTMQTFPNLTEIITHDQLQGHDGRDLHGYADGSFDVVYSSHCLEHILDWQVALSQWWRVVRRGGFLVLVVPDEEFYENLEWPSPHNPEHQHSWSLFKPQSDLPAHQDLLPFVLELIKHDGELERAMRLPWGDPEPGRDNTTYGCEAAMEVIARKWR